MMTDFSRLNKTEMYLLSAMGKNLLKEMIDQNQALVQAFRRELQGLNYSNLQLVRDTYKLNRQVRQEGVFNIQNLFRRTRDTHHNKGQLQVSLECPFLLQNTFFIVAFVFGNLPVFLQGLIKCWFDLSKEAFGILEIGYSLGIVILTAFLKLFYRYHWLKTKPIALTEGNKLASDRILHTQKRLSLRDFKELQKERRKNSLT